MPTACNLVVVASLLSRTNKNSRQQQRPNPELITSFPENNQEYSRVHVVGRRNTKPEITTYRRHWWRVVCGGKSWTTTLATSGDVSGINSFFNNMHYWRVLNIRSVEWWRLRGRCRGRKANMRHLGLPIYYNNSDATFKTVSMDKRINIHNCSLRHWTRSWIDYKSLCRLRTDTITNRQQSSTGIV